MKDGYVHRRVEEAARYLEENTELSEREAQVRAAVEHGFKHREISAWLGVEESTVKGYARRAREKERDAFQTVTGGRGEYEMECSQCGERFGNRVPIHCPECGGTMFTPVKKA